MSGFPIGQRIVDPRILSEELGGDPVPDMYSNLANYTFGSPRPPSLPYDRPPESTDSISPLSTFVPRLGSDRTPRPSVAPHSTNSPFYSVSSHPSQLVGLAPSSPSQPRRSSASRDSSPTTSGTRSGSDSEKSHDPIPSPDPIIAAFFRSQRGSVMPDNASQHTFGRASRTHGVTAASSRDGATPSSSSASVTSSRSSSRASMRTTEQFSSDDELEIEYFDGNSSPVTFARDYLVDIDEDMDLATTGPSTFQSTRFNSRRGSLPMAIPGASKSNDSHSARSRESSILTVRRPSRSWDESSVHRSSHSVEDPTIVLPKSEPLPRPGRLSLEVQLQGKSQQVEPSTYDGLDLTYILSKRSEGSIRSFNSRLSFIQAGVSSRRTSSPHLSGFPLALGSSSTLHFEDSFTRHLQKHDRSYDADRYYWSFQREKADGSTSSRRRRQAHPHSHAKSTKEAPSRVQEMWRCGHVGRFKVDRLAFKPQSADPGKAAQQRIQIRHIPDPYLMGNTISGPHSVIHKHSRAVAFSIFRSHGLFSGGRQAGGTGSHSGPPTHMNMRSGTMLALKKVQEQYTSTKTTRQLGPFQSGDKKLEKGDKGKGRTKASSKGRAKDKSDKKHRLQPTESAESSTATSSAGSVAHSAVRHVTSAPERPSMRVQFSPSASPTTHESLNRPVSSMSLLSTSIDNSIKAPQSESASLPFIRYHRDHRDSMDSEQRTPSRTTHAEAFSALDPNDIESLRSKFHNRTNADSGSTFERFLLRVFRVGSKTDDHSLFGTQPRAFQPPWMTTAGRDQQEETDRVLGDLDASFRDVGLLPNPRKPPKSGSKQRSRGGVLDLIPDDCLYMLLPLWPGETDAGGIRDETSSTASSVTAVENRQFLLVHYVPFSEGSQKDKKAEKKKMKQSQSSDSGIESDNKSSYLRSFRVVARVVAYDELRLSNIRIPSDGLAISGPEWEAINYPPSFAPDSEQMLGIIVCICDGRERGFDFMQDGLVKLGLAICEEPPPPLIPAEEEPIPEGKMILTPIGRAAVEMIWLGCLAITSFGST